MRSIATGLGLVAILLSQAVPVAPALARTGLACVAAKQYMLLRNQKRSAEAGSLFAPDAVFYNPRGVVLRGSRAIGEFFSNPIFDRADVKAENFVDGGRDCVFQLWSKRVRNVEGRYVSHPDGVYMLSAIDHFTVDDQGKVIKLVVFGAPPSHWQPEPVPPTNPNP